MSELHERRVFLRAAAAASAAWAAADLFQIDEALAWAAQQKTAPAAARAVRVLTRAQADAIDAMTARILPSVDGRPGAHEAGVVYFVDKSLATFNAAQKTVYAEGVADLNRRATEKSPGVAGFAALPPEKQDELLHDIEHTPFFQAARFDTIVGTFAVPEWGGNRGYAGWHMLGLDHQPAFQPPFGYYDANNSVSSNGASGHGNAYDAHDGNRKG
jgi:gluconate 2-dehydrogenase gamma chain